MPEPGEGWRARPLTVDVDLARGGRWASLRTPEREWLWRHPDPSIASARAAVRPGAAFIDAGGVEECMPTVRGEPDHGAIWSRPWSQDDGEDGGEAHVHAGGLRLSRRIRDASMTRDGVLAVDYTVNGPPLTPFVHAVHALLDVSPAAWLQVAGVRKVHILDRPADRSIVDWPAGDGWTPLDRLGPDDGTATAGVLPGCTAVTVFDGADALAFTWHATSGQACSLLLWRNLCGWPAGAPYRSIGIEPMVGTSASLDDPGHGRPASTGPGGRLSWELTLRAWQRVR